MSTTFHTTKQAKDVETALSQLSVGEVYDILVEVKAWVKKDPEAVKELLAQRPVLAQALLKMQTQMGMMQSLPPADVSFGAVTAYGSIMAPPPNMPSLPPSLPGGTQLPPPPMGMFGYPPPMVHGYMGGPLPPGMQMQMPPPGMMPPPPDYMQYGQQR
jgi:hypothetical protein